MSWKSLKSAVADMNYANRRLYELRTEPLPRSAGQLRTTKAVRAAH